MTTDYSSHRSRRCGPEMLQASGPHSKRKNGSHDVRYPARQNNPQGSRSQNIDNYGGNTPVICLQREAKMRNAHAHVVACGGWDLMDLRYLSDRWHRRALIYSEYKKAAQISRSHLVPPSADHGIHYVVRSTYFKPSAPQIDFCSFLLSTLQAEVLRNTPNMSTCINKIGC